MLVPIIYVMFFTTSIDLFSSSLFYLYFYLFILLLILQTVKQQLSAANKFRTYNVEKDGVDNWYVNYQGEQSWEKGERNYKQHWNEYKSLRYVVQIGRFGQYTCVHNQKIIRWYVKNQYILQNVCIIVLKKVRKLQLCNVVRPFRHFPTLQIDSSSFASPLSYQRDKVPAKYFLFFKWCLFTILRQRTLILC